jgi:hypothetical protein
MKTLEDMKELLESLDASQKVGNASLKLLREGQMNILAAQDKLWQSLGAVERKLEGLHDAMALFSENEDKLTLKLDAGLKGTADGVALALSDMRKSIDNIYSLFTAPPPKREKGKKRAKK